MKWPRIAYGEVEEDNADAGEKADEAGGDGDEILVGNRFFDGAGGGDSSPRRGRFIAILLLHCAASALSIFAQSRSSNRKYSSRAAEILQNSIHERR